MKYKCYFDGNERTGLTVDVKEGPREYGNALHEAVHRFMNKTEGWYNMIDAEAIHDVVIMPADDEAAAFHEWASDEFDPKFRLFRVKPNLSWSIDEVDSFNQKKGA